MGVLISLDSLKEGCFLDDSITKDGVLLYSKGTELTDNRIKNLINMLGEDYRVNVSFHNSQNYSEEEIMLLEYNQRISEQDFDIQGTVSKKVKDDTIQTLKKVFSSSYNSLSDTLSIVSKCINNITEQINNSENDFSYSLGQYKDEGKVKDLMEHSFRVAQFAVVLASIYNKSNLKGNKKPLDVESIGTAALLHDYGQRYIDPKEMKRLSVFQFSDEFLKNHPSIPGDLLQKPYNPKYNVVYSYVALKNAFSSTICSMVLRSSEPERGVLFKSNSINSSKNAEIGSKIIYLCNLYDSLLTNTLSQDYPLENVSTMMDQASVNDVINNDLYQLFKNNIPLYSKGVRVQLSTGEYAKVINYNLGADNSKPTVKTLTVNPNNSRIIDLRNEQSVTITRIISSNERLSDKIRNMAEQQLVTVQIDDNINELNENNNKRRY